MSFPRVSALRLQPLVELRAIYDRYGEFGLKEGIFVEGKRVGGGYFLRENPELIYDRIYTSSNPWSEERDVDGTDVPGSMFGDAFRGQGQAKPEPA